MVRGHDTFSFADSYEISDWLKMLLSQKYFFLGQNFVLGPERNSGCIVIITRAVVF